MDNPLLAYIVDTEDDGAAIAFGRNPMEARRLCAQELGFHYDEVSSCKRAPEYDGYAAIGHVPLQDRIEKFGWWQDCGMCSNRVELHAEREDEETGEWVEIEPQFSGDNVFCCPACLTAYEAEQARLKQTIVALKAGVVERFPGVTVGSVFPLNTPPFVEFSFPGGKHKGHWNLGEETVLLCSPDLEAWYAFRGKEVPVNG